MAILSIRALRAGSLAAVFLACAPIDVSIFPGTSEGGAGGSGGAPLEGPGGTPPVLGGAGGSSETISPVDDFEDGDTKGISPSGWWYTANDGTGTQTMAVEDANAVEEGGTFVPGRALHIVTEGFSEWGATFGIDVAEYSFGSGSLEISFFVAASREVEVSFHAIDGSGSHFTSNFFATPSWTRVAIRIDRLFVVDSAGVRSIDASTLEEIQWFVFGDVKSELWIDEVEFRSF